MIPDRTTAPFDGVYAATLTPLLANGSLDDALLYRHFRDMAAVDGIVGVLCNGHAGENFTLSREEKRRVVEIAAEAIGDKSIIVAGVNAEESREAARHAMDAQAAGADAVLVFPPFSWALSLDDDMAVAHHQAIAEATDIPLMLYQAGVHTGSLAYPPAVLERLVEIASVVAIKEGSWETSAYEANRRLVKRVAPHVAVMASGDEHLLSCFVLGSEGSLVSLAVLMPEVIVALDRAVRASDLVAARQLHDRIYPLAKAVYGVAPGGHATARLKTCMRLLGRWPSDRMRPPIGPLGEAEVAMLADALRLAGLAD
ncbi:MAG TPA: dihydrodipicolinate synthase family protein [Stellaceae bacterium]|nr:dihydrodipicolinate synthase family protein [Stellaceae bacterium]